MVTVVGCFVEAFVCGIFRPVFPACCWCGGVVCAWAVICCAVSGFWLSRVAVCFLLMVTVVSCCWDPSCVVCSGLCYSLIVVVVELYVPGLYLLCCFWLQGFCCLTFVLVGSGCLFLVISLPKKAQKQLHKGYFTHNNVTV